MKLTVLALSLLVSSLGFAAETYRTTFQTKNLGVLTVELKLALNLGQTAVATKNYFQQRIDQGQYGDWVCENVANFAKVLKVEGKVFDASGKLLGSLDNERYDRRKAQLSIGNRVTSPEEFACQTVDLSGNTYVYSQGYDATLYVDSSIYLQISLQGSASPAQVEKIGANQYALTSVSIPTLIKNARSEVQFSVNKDNGHYVNNLEHGYTKLQAAK